jgi:hypothetical protein
VDPETFEGYKFEGNMWVPGCYTYICYPNLRYNQQRVVICVARANSKGAFVLLLRLNDEDLTEGEARSKPDTDLLWLRISREMNEVRLIVSEKHMFI